MVQRFFKLDKNYILKEAQQSVRQELLQQMVAFVKEEYLRQSNPLGLIDDTVRTIQQAEEPSTRQLHDFYHILAGIYRYRHGSNQLELLFDGASHFEKYQQEWCSIFTEWYRQFCQKPGFIKAVLEVSVFYPKDRKGQLAEARMRAFLSQQFNDLRIHKRYGILQSKTA
ncbi:hypothetical protein [Nafulsella turpanensis]|uniref:hypothetical protein n=1 Tax=Nafulsella turpanensis TaxID=1265690 RepID=UPI00047672D9|nr:hypothetical protein [Nafulsella turpanensis]